MALTDWESIDFEDPGDAEADGVLVAPAPSEPGGGRAVAPPPPPPRAEPAADDDDAAAREAAAREAAAREAAAREAAVPDEPGLVYQFEYLLELPARASGGERLTLHNIAVIAQRGGTLYTLTVLCREADWPKRERTLREVARSFRLTS